MEKNGFLVKEPIVISKKSSNCFVLSEFGKGWVRRNLPYVNNLAKPARQGTTHDLFLFEEVAKLPQKLQDAALTEYDILAQYGRRENSSPPDLFIPSHIDDSGVEQAPQAIEILTRTYIRRNIIEKETFCKHVLNLKKEEINYVKAV